MGYALFQKQGKGKIMENNKLAVLQAKRDAFKKAIKDKQKEMDCFDVSEYYGEDDYKQDMREAYGTVTVIGYEYSAIDALYELDSIAFREMYNDYTDSLDKGDFEEYRELEEELEELENELSEIEEQIEQLENNKLAALQAKRYKRYKLIKAIRAKQEELECFDVEKNYDEDMFVKYLGEAGGKVVFMWREYESIQTMQKVDSSAFQEMYNDYTDSLDKSDFEEYRELEKELKGLENELLEIEDEIEQLENE